MGEVHRDWAEAVNERLAVEWKCQRLKEDLLQGVMTYSDSLVNSILIHHEYNLELKHISTISKIKWSISVPEMRKSPISR